MYMKERKNKGKQRSYAIIDRLLVHLCTGLIAALLVSQCLLLNQDTRQYLSLVDKLEGEQIAAVLPSQAENTPYIKEEDKISSFVSRSLLSLRPGKNLVIRMINPPANTDVFVTINGENAGNFHEGSLKLTVFEGDYVEIDVTALKQQPARFVIDASREDVITPQPGLLLEATEPIIVVGRVKLK